ncbi:MAG: FAD binding domain-containing protein [Devosiaceae bacterium]|nr:FAD binding domain-containing protein [Devosiaceae bacterium MH13]
MTQVETVASLADAARQVGGDAAYFGGGTVLMRAVNAGEGPARLIRAADPALRDVRVSGDRVRLGAGVTMAQVLRERDLEFLHPVARQIGGPQVRAMGTVGGNLFAPHPYGDFAVALLALGADVTLANGGTARPLDDVLRDRDRAPVLVSAVEFSRPRDGAFGFHKVSRVKPKGVSVLAIAVHAPQSAGRIQGARVAWGAMGPAPMRGNAVERVLEGATLDAITIDRAAQVATEGLTPPTDALATSWYRSEVAGVHLKRLLTSMGGR